MKERLEKEIVKIVMGEEMTGGSSPRMVRR